jgi:predicted transcriptional regulator
LKDDSFSVDVITRILSILSSEGNMKRTVLAGKARLNYSALIRYLKFLKTLRWVDFSSDSGSLISITAVGRSFRKLLDREDVPQDISKEVLNQLTWLTEEISPAKVTYNESSESCLFCGNTIEGRVVSKEIDGVTYSFDKRECAVLFSKFRDVYGKEFPL